jgi:hypothetical protein
LLYPFHAGRKTKTLKEGYYSRGDGIAIAYGHFFFQESQVYIISLGGFL